MDQKLENTIRELVVANRILAREGVINAYGHVSIRHPHDPERYLLAWSRSPELVGLDDILEFTLDGKMITQDKRPPYRERFIHSGIYLARPDVTAVVHAHAEDVLPFGVTNVPLRPIIHAGSFIGEHVPVWDIADKFGDETNLLVETLEQGKDLAKSLADNNVALMRGHGFAAAAGTLIDAVRLSVYTPRNARVQVAAMRLGEPRYLSSGEINERFADKYYSAKSHGTTRAWDYWATRAGCSDMLPKLKFSDDGLVIDEA